MKRVGLLFLTLLVSITFTDRSAKADNEIKIEGIFQGENLFVMNPFPEYRFP